MPAEPPFVGGLELEAIAAGVFKWAATSVAHGQYLAAPGIVTTSAIIRTLSPHPGAQLHAVSGPGLIRRYGKGPDPLRQPDVRSVRTPEVNEIILAVTVKVSTLPGAQLHAVSGPGLIRRYGKGPVPLRQPDVRSVRTPEVNEIILAVTVKVSTLPGAQLDSICH